MPLWSSFKRELRWSTWTSCSPFLKLFRPMRKASCYFFPQAQRVPQLAGASLQSPCRPKKHLKFQIERFLCFDNMEWRLCVAGISQAITGRIIIDFVATRKTASIRETNSLRDFEQDDPMFLRAPMFSYVTPGSLGFSRINNNDEKGSSKHVIFGLLMKRTCSMSMIEEYPVKIEWKKCKNTSN